jgi:hypothetical protein
MNSAAKGAANRPSSPSPSVITDFAPVRPRGGRRRLRRALRRRRRALVSSLVVTAAVLAAAPLTDAIRPERGERSATAGAREGPRDAALVSAPVRIADPGAVRLLRRGDVVDVLAVAPPRGPARVVARRARVTGVPAEGRTGAGGGGALLVLAVTPGTAAELAGAAAGGELAVARW